MPPKFQRTKFRAYVKLGSGQKSKLVYRRAKGRHNKTRQKWRSRPPMVEVGYKNENKTRNLINGKVSVLVYNLKDLSRVTKENIIILGKIGAKAKIEIAKEIEKKGLEVFNLNIRKLMKNLERKKKLNTKTINKIEDKKEKSEDKNKAGEKK